MDGRRSQNHRSISADPKLPQLGRYGTGPFRLHWLGALERTPKSGSPTGLMVTAQFVDLSTRAREPFEVQVPFQALPFLAAGSIWRNQLFSSLEDAPTATVSLDMARFAHEQHRARAPSDLFPTAYDPIERMASPCWCRVLPLTDGSEIIVPSWEILRSQYLFHPKVIPALIAGAADNHDALSESLLPWRPGPTETFRLSDRVVQITHPQWVGGDLAKRLAQLLFDPAARDGLRHLHHSLRLDMLRNPQAIKIPPVKPALAGEGDWTIRYRRVPSFRGMPPRRLVLSIHAIRQPLPYELVIPVALNDNRSTPDRHDELPQYTRPRIQTLLAEDEAADLYGSAGDSRLRTVSVVGLEVAHSAAQVQEFRWDKESQKFRSAGGGNETDVVADEVGLDPSGLPQIGRPEVSAADRSGRAETAPPRPAVDMLRMTDMKRVFADVMRRLRTTAGTAGWTIEPFSADGGAAGIVRVHPATKGRTRAFILLHIHRAGRHIYLADAARNIASETFSIFIGETPDGAALTIGQVTRWLEGFPYDQGPRWLGSAEDDLLLLPDYAIHQARDSRVSDAEIHERFVRRLTKFVTTFMHRA